MKRPTRAPILTLDQLETWFDRAKPRPHCAGVSMMDGFLTALVIGPVFIHPEKWIWHIVGDHEKRAFTGTKAQAVIDTVVDHYNQISTCLAENRFAYKPLFMRSLDGETSAEDWANGFYGAMRLGVDYWKPLFENFETAAPVMAILIHCSAPDGDSPYGDAMRDVPPEALTDGWKLIREVVHTVLDQCAPLRAASEQTVFRTA
jgi:uncharacterized protein